MIYAFLRQKLESIILRNTQVSKYNLYSLAIIGGFTHLPYWYLYTYLYPMPQENIILRLIGTISCLLLFTVRFWSDYGKKFLPLYWFFVVMYNTSFFFTTYFITSNYSLFWSIAMMGMIFFSITLIPELLLLILNLTLGVTLAILYSKIVTPQFVYFDPTQMLFIYFPTFSFALVVGYIFSYKNLQGVQTEQKLESALEKAEQHKRDLALAGGIAHDVQSFIFRLKGLFGITFLILKDKKTSDGSIHLENSDIKKFIEIEKSAYSTAKHASRNIDEILSTISGTPIDKTNFTYYSANEIAQTAKAEFGYRSSSHVAKVKLDLKNDFVLKADESLLLSVLFNLMKNSFDFLPKKPEMEITIGTEIIDDRNVIYVHDTGIGIPEDVRNKLFETFVTGGKVGGIGIGLASCKRILQAFGGDIICDSKIREYAKFSLLFPKLSQEEAKQAYDVVQKRRKQMEREQANLLSY